MFKLSAVLPSNDCCWRVQSKSHPVNESQAAPSTQQDYAALLRLHSNSKKTPHFERALMRNTSWSWGYGVRSSAEVGHNSTWYLTPTLDDVIQKPNFIPYAMKVKFTPHSDASLWPKGALRVRSCMRNQIHWTNDTTLWVLVLAVDITIFSSLSYWKKVNQLRIDQFLLLYFLFAECSRLFWNVSYMASKACLDLEVAGPCKSPIFQLIQSFPFCCLHKI